MMDHLSLYKGFGSFLILSFTSSSVRCGVTRVILPMIFSLSLTHDGLCKESYYRRQGGMSITLRLSTLSGETIRVGFSKLLKPLINTLQLLRRKSKASSILATGIRVQQRVGRV